MFYCELKDGITYFREGLLRSVRIHFTMSVVEQCISTAVQLIP